MEFSDRLRQIEKRLSSMEERLTNLEQGPRGGSRSSMAQRERNGPVPRRGPVQRDSSEPKPFNEPVRVRGAGQRDSSKKLAVLVLHHASESGETNVLLEEVSGRLMKFASQKGFSPKLIEVKLKYVSTPPHGDRVLKSGFNKDLREFGYFAIITSISVERLDTSVDREVMEQIALANGKWGVITVGAGLDSNLFKENSSTKYKSSGKNVHVNFLVNFLKREKPEDQAKNDENMKKLLDFF